MGASKIIFYGLMAFGPHTDYGRTVVFPDTVWNTYEVSKTCIVPFHTPLVLQDAKGTCQIKVEGTDGFRSCEPSDAAGSDIGRLVLEHLSNKVGKELEIRRVFIQEHVRLAFANPQEWIELKRTGIGETPRDANDAEAFSWSTSLSAASARAQELIPTCLDYDTEDCPEVSRLELTGGTLGVCHFAHEENNPQKLRSLEFRPIGGDRTRLPGPLADAAQLDLPAGPVTLEVYDMHGEVKKATLRLSPGRDGNATVFLVSLPIALVDEADADPCPTDQVDEQFEVHYRMSQTLNQKDHRPVPHRVCGEYYACRGCSRCEDEISRLWRWLNPGHDATEKLPHDTEECPYAQFP